jgi:polyisoprenoid-binding protein YceI
MVPGRFRFSFCMAITLGAMSAATADTDVPNIDIGKSSLVATFRQENVPIEAPFRRYNGTVSYEPTNVQATVVSFDVEAGSLDVGDSSYDAEIRKPSWFDTQRFPHATFRSTAVTATSPSVLECVGILTIKGTSQTVKTVVSIRKSPGGAAFDGSLPVSRKSYGIGSKEWDDILEDMVILKFHIIIDQQL